MCHIRGRMAFVKPEQVRTTINIPAPLYCKLKTEAAAQGCSIDTLILRGVESVLMPSQSTTHRVQFLLIRSEGPKVSLSNEQIYEHVEFA